MGSWDEERVSVEHLSPEDCRRVLAALLDELDMVVERVPMRWGAADLRVRRKGSLEGTE